MRRGVQGQDGRGTPATGESGAMKKVLMRKTAPEEPPEERHAPELERQLLRTSVVDMTAHRRACSACGRTPLVGERIQVCEGKHGRERALCDLCAPEACVEPLRMERVWPVILTLARRAA